MEVKKEVNHVCENCLNTFSADKMVIVLKESFFGERMNHSIIICDDCFKKGDFKFKDYYTTRKPVIDTTDWIEHGQTKTGTKMYDFLDENGKKFVLTAENGLKKNFKPKLKK